MTVYGWLKRCWKTILWPCLFRFYSYISNTLVSSMSLFIHVCAKLFHLKVEIGITQRNKYKWFSCYTNLPVIQKGNSEKFVAENSNQSIFICVRIAKLNILDHSSLNWHWIFTIFTYHFLNWVTSCTYWL